MPEPDDAKIIGDGRFLKLLDRGGWEFTHRTNCTGIVVIVAVTGEGKLLLTEQYRPPVRGRLIDPAPGFPMSARSFG